MDALASSVRTQTISKRHTQHLWLPECRARMNESKIENLTELINATRNYVASDTNVPLIIDFLNNIALDQNTEKNENNLNSVQLMTLHASKGLEFNYVF